MTPLKPKSRSAPIVLLASLLLSSCAISTGHLTALSTSPLPPPVQVDKRAIGRDCVRLLFGLIPLSNRAFFPSIERATEAALAQGEGNAILGARISQTMIVVPLVFTRVCYVVEGTLATVAAPGVHGPMPAPNPETETVPPADDEPTVRDQSPPASEPPDVSFGYAIRYRQFTADLNGSGPEVTLDAGFGARRPVALDLSVGFDVDGAYVIEPSILSTVRAGNVFPYLKVGWGWYGTSVEFPSGTAKVRGHGPHATGGIEYRVGNTMGIALEVNGRFPTFTAPSDWAGQDEIDGRSVAFGLHIRQYF